MNNNVYLIRHLDRIDNDDCSIDEMRKWNSTHRKEYIFRVNPYICQSNNKLNKLVENLISKGNPEFDHIICSPFLRCIETAILVKNKYANIKNKTINIEFNLSEFLCEDFGFIKPIDIKTVYEHSKSYLAANYKDFELNNINTTLMLTEYETDEEYTARIQKVLAEIKSKYSGNILIVSHKDALELNMKYGEVYKLNIPEQLDEKLKGGYYNKYLKYKAKYLKLKNNSDY